MPYRTLSLSAWNLPKLRGLPYGTKALYVYFLLNRHSQLSGVYELSKAYITADTSLELPRIETAMTKLIEVDAIAYDETNEVIWVKDLLALQGFHEELNWQALTRIVRQLQSISYSPLVHAAVAEAAARKLFAGADLDTLSHRVSHRVSIPPKAKAKAQAHSPSKGKGGAGGKTNDPNAPGDMGEKLVAAILEMQTTAFHGLAKNTVGNTEFWTAQIKYIEDFDGVNFYACLRDVDQHWVGRRSEWPRGLSGAKRCMTVAIKVAVNKIREQQRRRTPNAHRAAR